jgi:hypothetical protein
MFSSVDVVRLIIIRKYLKGDRMNRTIRNVNDFLKQIKDTPEIFCIIHYSCESLNDENEGMSPRITSIAVLDYVTTQTVSFSIHSIAEKLGISKEEVPLQLDDIEKQLLNDFYSYLNKIPTKLFIHWNMRNAHFGFEHLEHRYTVLFKEKHAPVEIEVHKRINLSSMLCSKYGESYSPHPKLENLMKMNNINKQVSKNFLTGKQEVEAFNNREYVKMHSSTLSKVEFYRRVIQNVLSKKLKTDSKRWEIYLERLYESIWVKLITLIATFLALALGVKDLFHWVSALNF